MFVLPFAWSSKHINQGIPQQKWSRAGAGSRASASRVSPRVARGEECRWFRRRLGQRCQFCRRWSRRPGSDDSEKKGIQIVMSLSSTEAPAGYPIKTVIIGKWQARGPLPLASLRHKGELKQRRFWGTDVNRKWTFCILGQWFGSSSLVNGLYKRRDT